MGGRVCTIVLVLLLVVLMALRPALACSSDGTDCSTCIRNRMKFNCPACTSSMQCMARCLWAGTSRANCIKKCDCNKDYPRLADCKKCLVPCKCKCSA